MITTGLMKSERVAMERDKRRAASMADARQELNPPWPYATLPFPELFGVTEISEQEKNEQEKNEL